MISLSVIPDVVMYAVPVSAPNAFTPALFVGPLGRQYKGIVNVDGTWQHEAASGWISSRLDVGKYRVQHFQANVHYSLNLSPITVGNIHVIQMNDTLFDVQVTDSNANPLDAGFTFALSFM